MKSPKHQQRVASSSVDIEVEGQQHGYLSVPAARDRSPLGTVRIPVCILRYGEGPTVVVLAGVNGDEFEGRIALQNLAASLEPDDISGCVVLIPALNAPACEIGTRRSPIDQSLLGNCFPGNPTGTVSEQIAAIAFDSLIKKADLVVELRSGGDSTVYTPLAAVHFNESSDQQDKAEQSMVAFGAPYSARLSMSHDDTLAASLQHHEIPHVRACLGGGGSAVASRIEVAMTGCRNVLVQMGVLQQELVLRSTRMLEVTSEKNYVIAPSSGLLEMCRDTGDEVYMGSPVAKIIQPGETGSKPLVLQANRNGILMARHHHGMICQGDCVAIVADEVQR